jgi:hypothetical protein
MTQTQEKFDDVLRKMLQTPHKPNVSKPKRAAKKTSRKKAKTKKPAQ